MRDLQNLILLNRKAYVNINLGKSFWTIAELRNVSEKSSTLRIPLSTSRISASPCPESFTTTHGARSTATTDGRRCSSWRSLGSSSLQSLAPLISSAVSTAQGSLFGQRVYGNSFCSWRWCAKDQAKATLAWMVWRWVIINEVLVYFSYGLYNFQSLQTLTSCIRETLEPPSCGRRPGNDWISPRCSKTKLSWIYKTFEKITLTFEKITLNKTIGLNLCWLNSVNFGFLAGIN